MSSWVAVQRTARKLSSLEQESGAPQAHESNKQTARPSMREPPSKKQRDNSGPDSDSSSDGEILDDGEVESDNEDCISLDCPDDELLADLEKDLDDSEKTSKSVAQSIADIINKRIERGLSDEKLKQRLDKYTRPENCQNLQVPTINPEVWKKHVPATMKQHDLKLAMAQRAIV